MKFKKRISLLCAAVLLLSFLAGCGAAAKPGDVATTGKDTASAQEGETTAAGPENPYEEHYKYTVATFDGPELLEWPIVKDAYEKFNVEFELVTIPWDGWGDKLNTMVAASALPEVVAWYDLNYGRYVNWAKQGVFKALPDLSKYPNIMNANKDIQNTVLEKLKVDGKLYTIPKTINRNPINNIDNLFYVYRRDWAVKMGYSFEQVQEMAWEELVKYLADVKAKDPGGVGKEKVIPLDCQGGFNDIWGIVSVFNPYITKYTKVDGQYVWGAALPQTVEAIKELQSLYQQGLLAKDFYTYKNGQGHEKFIGGLTAVLQGFPSVVDFQSDVDSIKKIVPDYADKDYGVLLVKSPDGKIHVNEKMQYWAASAYSASIDDKKLDRMLQIHDWLLEPETVKYLAFGLPGVDWEMQGDQVNLKWPKNEKGDYDLNKDNGKDYIRNQWNFQKWFRLEGDDVWIPGNPFYRDEVKKIFTDAKTKMEQIGTVLVANDYDLDFFSAPNKDKYGVFDKDVQNEITKLIVSSKNIEKDWNDWVTSMMPKVQLVLDEINAQFGDK